jgi:hypothetical protein
MATFEPITRDELAEQIAVGVHTGLRKGSEAPTSGPLWQAISASDDGAWMDACRYAAWGLEQMGYEIRKRVM